MSGVRARSGVSAAALAAVIVALSAIAGAARAEAATPAPAWSVSSYGYPTNFSTSDNAGCSLSTNAVESLCDTFTVTATNIGGATTSGAVTIEDELPPGVTPHRVSLLWSGLSSVPNRHENEDLGEAMCTTVPLRCKVPAIFFSENHKPGAPAGVQPDETLKMWVSVTVDEPAAARLLTNEAIVSGGNAASVTTSSANSVEVTAPPLGFSAFDAPLSDAAGAAQTQAGAHPYELSTQLDLNSVMRETPEGAVGATTVKDVRDVIVDLPPGLAGSAVSAPACTLHQLSSRGARGEQGVSGCPASTIVGHIRSYPTGFLSVNSPIYNIVPEQGTAAEFGFIDNAGGTHVLYASLAPTPAGYVLRTRSRELAQVPLDQITADVFGDPAARDGSGEAAIPTFTNPEDCSGEALRTTAHLDSWAAPGSYEADGSPDFGDPNWASAEYESPPVTGCAALAGLFRPTVQVQSESSAADSPTGFDFTLEVPQSEGAETLATPPLRDAIVTLPAGMAVNPSSANGLEACSLAQVGISPGGLPDAAAPACPGGSRIGTVEVETPALPAEACRQAGKALRECPNQAEREKTPLLGSIYLARQGENPFGSLLAIYIAIDDPRTGVIVKLPAEVKASAASGQLTTIVKDSPQFPFSELRTHFFGGATASLRTPAACGTFSVSTTLTPWSAPESGPPATPESSFAIDRAADGTPCVGTAPFSPALSAGTASAQAAAYTSLSTSFARGDAEDLLGAISITTPPGLLGSLRTVSECPEPQAAQGSCGPDSLLGEATTAVGAGPHPYWVHGGRVYLTGPYGGGPFGLSIVVPTSAGPFTLTGNGGLGREIVRASIRVDPHTAQITVHSDPLPTILEGIPLEIRTVDVTINRPGFIFNPSDCAPLAFASKLTGESGATSAKSASFQAANCATLPFRPTLTATAGGRASKADGAGLQVKLRSAGVGQANIAKVELQLPKALPSRLTTIQKACLEAVFEADPAACDEGALIGTATVQTPLLRGPLSGPGYLVSHGGAAFPDVEFVLQGEGVTLVLDGKTDIKKGITYSRFESVPDAPFTEFVADLPSGPHSALTANVPEKQHYSLCGASLSMPSEIVGQNGAIIRQTTPIAVTGCVAPRPLTRAQELARAMRTCHGDRKRRRRIACERAARRRYGPRRVRRAGKRAGSRRRAHR